MHCIAREQEETVNAGLAQNFVQRGHDIRDPPDGRVVTQAVADLTV